MIAPYRHPKPNSVTLELCFDDCPNVITAIRKLPEAIQKLVVTAAFEPPMPFGDMVGHVVFPGEPGGPPPGYQNGPRRPRQAPPHLQVVDEDPETPPT
jgi:hypothetical protein